MYNRYIPQPDGSYRRSRMGDPQPCAPTPPPPMPAPPESPPCPPPPTEKKQPIPSAKSSMGAGDFLRQLLPKNLDTGDLLIVLLLLLIAGDCKEDQNTALLTLALYLFM